MTYGSTKISMKEELSDYIKSSEISVNHIQQIYLRSKNHKDRR